jgi:hypothetical protein
MGGKCYGENEIEKVGEYRSDEMIELNRASIDAINSLL